MPRKYSKLRSYKKRKSRKRTQRKSRKRTQRKSRKQNKKGGADVDTVTSMILEGKDKKEIFDYLDQSNIPEDRKVSILGTASRIAGNVEQKQQKQLEGTRTRSPRELQDKKIECLNHSDPIVWSNPAELEAFVKGISKLGKDIPTECRKITEKRKRRKQESRLAESGWA